MRSYITLPTDEQVAVRKRLRLICEWFKDLNKDPELAAWDEKDEKNSLPLGIVEKIEAQGFDRADLMAIRDRPHSWTNGYPYEWLWILHRYQNTHQKK